MPSNSRLSALGSSQPEVDLLAGRGEEIVGYAMTALLDSFSRRRARKVMADFGLSDATSASLLLFIETDAEFRKELAARFLERARLAALGWAVGVALAFVPSIPRIYVGVIAVCAVYGVLSLLAFRRYARKLKGNAIG